MIDRFETYRIYRVIYVPYFYVCTYVYIVKSHHKKDILNIIQNQVISKISYDQVT